MSIFDPFDPARMEDHPTCICGRHRSQAEHDDDAQRQLQCVPATSEDKRYEGVVAAAALRGRAPRG